MITIKRNDTGIGIKATLSNKDGAVDLTDADVLFLMDKHEITPVVEDAENGIVLVTFNEVHTSQTGILKAEFEVAFADGRKETFPNDDYLKVHIMNDLGGR